MRITAKGHVTIPIGIRKTLGLLPETEVTFKIRDDAVLLRKNSVAGTTRLGPYLERMRGRAGAGLSTDEIMSLTRDPRRYRTHFPRLDLICP
jgi:AbrB family looped-hinge helix DNA binding protein